MSFTFEDFYVGESNRAAFQRAREAAIYAQPYTAPLFLYGPSDTGKTHLLRAISQEYQLRRPGQQVLRTTADLIAERLIDSIHMDDPDLFTGTYLSQDVLLVDDLHLLAGKSATQADLFDRVVKPMVAQGRLVVLVCDRDPAKLLDPDAIPEGMLTDQVPVPEPDRACRLAAAKDLAAFQDLELDDDTLDHVVENTRTVPQVASALLWLNAFRRMDPSMDPTAALRRQLKQEAQP